MKTALITGTNKGIGREVARQLAAKGFHVFVGVRRRKTDRKAVDDDQWSAQPNPEFDLVNPVGSLQV